MSNIPKKQHKLMIGLSDYLSTVLKEIIKDKENIYNNLDPKHSCYTFGQMFNSDNFKNVTKNFNEEQWNILISQANKKIEIKQNEKLKEEKALNNLLLEISKDEVLKNHNISIVELVLCGKKDYIIKVYFVCGAYFLEGNTKELLEQFHQIIKENKINLKIFCPNCSNKNLRFIEEFCLCNNCGAFSLPEENKVLKIYKKEDKSLWWAKVLVEFKNFQE